MSFAAHDTSKSHCLRPAFRCNPCGKCVRPVTAPLRALNGAVTGRTHLPHGLHLNAGRRQWDLLVSWAANDMRKYVAGHACFIEECGDPANDSEQHLTSPGSALGTVATCHRS